MTRGCHFTVFTKPWKMPLPELAKFVHGLGFDGIELPVRPGFQVEPEKVLKDLPVAVKVLSDHGLKIGSVAGPVEEQTIAACGQCGIPIIRICPDIPADMTFMAAVDHFRKEWDRVIPLLGRAGVAVGLQNHCGRSFANSMQVRYLIEQYDPRHICAVWDAGHNGLSHDQIDLSLDIIGSHLRLVNLKSAFWMRTNGPEAEVAEWKAYWTTGRNGAADWPRVARELHKRGYAGNICLTAEYSDHGAVDRLIAEDLRFAKSLFTG